MELAAALMLAKPVLKLLVGSRITGDEAASAVGNLLGLLLTTQDQTLRTLSRLEGKVDQLILQRFQTEMLAGFSNLRDAEAAYRSVEDKVSLLDVARQAFVGARASAPSVQAAVEADLLVATCWLGRHSREDFFANMARASETSLSGLLAAERAFAQPERKDVFERYEQTRGLAGRLKALVDGGTTMEDPYLAKARAELRREAATEVVGRTQLFNQVQELRRESGTEARLCPSLAGFWRAGREDLDPPTDAADLETWVWMGGVPVFRAEGGSRAAIGGVEVDVANPTGGATPGETSTYVVEADVEVVLDEHWPPGVSDGDRQRSSPSASATGEWPWASRPRPASASAHVSASLTVLPLINPLSGSGFPWDGSEILLRRPSRNLLHLRDVCVTPCRRVVLWITNMRAPAGGPTPFFSSIFEYRVDGG